VQVELTKSELTKEMTHKQRDFLDKLADDEDSLNGKQIEFLAQLGHWLLAESKKVKVSYTHCYKGGTFWYDVIDSLSGFNRNVVESILSLEKKEYSYADLIYYWKEEKTSAQKVPSWTSFKHFIETFQYKGELLVESINNKDKTFIVMDKYIPDNLNVNLYEV